MKPDLEKRMRKDHVRAFFKVRMREAQRRGGNRYRGCSYLRFVLCADGEGTGAPPRTATMWNQVYPVP